ncbi:MAG: hypothetical protein JRD89_02880 [Deltaproteobacteria bacterium]|nr:hypothetical protein [Deltaproteobacteria bacterium]
MDAPELFKVYDCERKEECVYKQEEIDMEIRDLVNALNLGGVPTWGSCSGHGTQRGFILLKDGRTLIILPAVDDSYTWVERELEFNAKTSLPADSSGCMH